MFRSKEASLALSGKPSEQIPKVSIDTVEAG